MMNETNTFAGRRNMIIRTAIEMGMKYNVLKMRGKDDVVFEVFGDYTEGSGIYTELHEGAAAYITSAIT